MNTKILDWIKKVFSIIKEYGFIIAIVISVIFFVSRGCNKKQNGKFIEKIAVLNIENDILVKKNNDLDNALSIKDSSLAIKNSQIDSINSVKKKSDGRAFYWKTQHDNISEDLIKITSDSSYNFLQFIFDSPGIKKYPFNELQVKSIHQIYLENKNKKQQLIWTDNSLSACETKVGFLEDSKKIIEDKFALKSTQLDNMIEINSNNNEKIELLKKQLKKESKWFAGFGIGPNLDITYIDGKFTPIIGIGIQYNIYKW